MRCPSEDAVPLLAPVTNVTTNWSYNYALNDVHDDADGNIGAAWANQSEIKFPTSTVLFVDGWPLKADPGSGNGQDRHVVDWVSGERDRLHRALDDGNPRHIDHFVIVLCDTHVKTQWRGRLPNGLFDGGTVDDVWYRDP